MLLAPAYLVHELTDWCRTRHSRQAPHCPRQARVDRNRSRDSGGDLAIENVEPFLPGHGFRQFHRQPRTSDAPQLIDLDDAIDNMGERLAKKQASAERREIDLHASHRAARPDERVAVGRAGDKAPPVAPPTRVQRIELPNRRVEQDDERDVARGRLQPTEGGGSVLQPAAVPADGSAEAWMREGHRQFPPAEGGLVTNTAHTAVGWCRLALELCHALADAPMGVGDDRRSPICCRHIA